MRVFSALTISLCTLVLSGCEAITGFNATSNPTNPSPTSTATIHGIVHGGQNPVSGGHVYLYAVGGTGYGGASVSLLTSGTKDANGNYYVTTASDGSFSVTGDYTCPVANTYPATYLLATGGNSGSGNNPAISLVAPVGNCTSANYSSEFVVVNEITTIASVYAASGFITDLTHVSAPSTAMANIGFNNIDTGNLNNTDGTARTTTQGGNGTVPQTEINTLANILAACVNSNGAVTGPTNPSPCYTLFNSAPSGGTGGTVPTDTAAAALNIARNPGNVNIANLFGLQTANSPFQPGLSAAPHDFTIAITYTGGGLNTPARLAIDGKGNVWVTNNGSGSKSISEFGSDGTAITTATGFTGGGLDLPLGIAIDSSDNVWVTNDAAAGISLSQLNSSGQPNLLSPFTGGGLAAPEDIAIDTSGNVWTPDLSSSALSEFSSTGMPITAAGGTTTGGLNSPIFIAIDSAGNIWVSNANGNSLSEFNSGGTAIPASPFTGGGLNFPHGVAVDASNNIWIASRGANALSEFSSSGVALSATGYSGGGQLNQPNDVAVDSAGMIWVINHGGNSLSEFNSSGTAVTSSGYVGGSGVAVLSAPNVLAIDSSGNIWVNNTTMLNGSYAITEFVGLASPVVTPMVANFLSPYSHAASKP